MKNNMYWVCDLTRFNIPADTDFKEVVKQVHESGMQGMALLPRLLENEKEALEISKLMYDLDLKWYVLPYPVDFLHPDVTQEQFDNGIEIYKRWAELGQKMGVKQSYNHVFSSGHLPFDENFERHARRIFRIQNICENNNMRYCLEYVGEMDVRTRWEHEFLYSLPGMLALSEAAGGKTGFVYDTYHTYNGGRLQEDFYLALQLINRCYSMHFSDGIPGWTREQQLDLTRSYPMTTGIVDSRTQVRALENAGFHGPLLIEPYNPKYDKHLKSISWQEAVKEYRRGYHHALKNDLSPEEQEEYKDFIKKNFLDGIV